MNLNIYIPCLNEESNLAKTVNLIPKKIKNINKIKIIVVDDFSTDKTVQVAQKLDIFSIIKLKSYKGLAKLFDIIVDNSLKDKECNFMCILDADNQYKAQDIQKLIDEMIEKKSNIVVGERNIIKNSNMSLVKKIFQKLGSSFVSALLMQNISDVTSGFRIYDKNSFDNYIQLDNNFSYTIESLLFFKWSKKKISTVSIDTNTEVLRKSRLFKSNSEYILKQLGVILNSFTLYFPIRFFLLFSTLFFIPGFFLFLRFFYFYFLGIDGHVQSLIISSILIVVSILFASLGIIMNAISKIWIMQKNKLNSLNLDYIEEKINYTQLKN